MQLFHGSALCRRCDAQLPVDQLPRCAGRAPALRPAPGAGVCRLAGRAGPAHRRPRLARGRLRRPAHARAARPGPGTRRANRLIHAEDEPAVRDERSNGEAHSMEETRSLTHTPSDPDSDAQRVVSRPLPTILEHVRARTPARILTGRAGAAYRTTTYLELR